MKISIKIPQNMILLLFTLSNVFLFFPIESTFSIQSILPIICLIALWLLFKHKRIKIRKQHYYAIIIIVLSVVSLIYNMIIRPYIVGNVSLVRTIYSAVVLMYFIMATSYKAKLSDVRFFVSIYTCVALISSLLITLNYISGGDGKIVFTTLTGLDLGSNQLAAYLALIPLIQYLQFIYTKSYKMKFYHALTFIMSIFSVFLVGSRAAFIAVVISVLLCILYQFFFVSTYSMNKKVGYFILTTLILAVVIFLCYRYLPDFVIQRFIRNSYSDQSNSDRLLLWSNGLNGIKNSPLLGYGTGNFNYYTTMVLPGHQGVVVAHNTFLDFILDSGLLGFFAYIMLFFHSAKVAFLKKNRVLIFFLINIFITSFIIGAERLVYFWNMIILFTLCSDVIGNNTKDSVKDILSD